MNIQAYTYMHAFIYVGAQTCTHMLIVVFATIKYNN